MKAALYIVTVRVRYSHPAHPGQSASRYIPVRIVSTDEQHAQSGAMFFAQQISPVDLGMVEGSVAFAELAATLVESLAVDCIGESCRYTISDATQIEKVA